jgi:hypothetical protein
VKPGASNKANADRFAANVLPVIQQIKASGATSLRAVAKALTARGVANSARRSVVASASQWRVAPGVLILNIFPGSPLALPKSPGSP